HALKVVNLTGPELPCPPNTIGVHIKDVIRADLFGSAGPDTVKLNRTSVPPLTVVHSASRRLDPASFDDPLLFHTLPPGSQGVPDDLLGPLTTTAAAWTVDCETDWEEITTIRDRLQTDYVHDPEAGEEEDGSTVLRFLQQSKRGRAYQFATACCLMLRCRGYGARVVGGFYADDENYDRSLGHTVVRPEDVHVWCEVAVAPGVWATVDATPGYEPLAPLPTWRDHIVTAVASAGRFVVDNPAASTVVALAFAGLIVFRRRLADAADVLGWRIARVWRDERAAVVSAVRVLDRRCRRFGPARPPGLSPPRHFAALPGTGGFADAAARGLFGPTLHPDDLSAAAAAVSSRSLGLKGTPSERSHTPRTDPEPAHETDP
ncbi:MAG: transglutaminase-like domain-containing protein, partial [Planctomycetota bacterium]